MNIPRETAAIIITAQRALGKEKLKLRFDIQLLFSIPSNQFHFYSSSYTPSNVFIILLGYLATSFQEVKSL